MIENKSIKDISLNLVNIAKEMKEDIECAKKHLKLVADIETQFMKLKEITYNLKKSLFNHKKDLEEIQETIKELKLLESFDPIDPMSEEDAILFAKGQSMISDNNNIKSSTSVNFMNKNLSQVFGNIRSLLRGTTIEEPYEEVKVLKEQKEPKLRTNTCEDTRNNSMLSYKESMENIVLKIDDKLVPVSSVNLDFNNIANSAKELAVAEKFCASCKQFTQYAIILECFCVICLDCLQKNTKARNPDLLDNVFEAARDQCAGMCSCPKHKIPINMSILSKVFGYSNIEKASIEALKRQINFNTEQNTINYVVCYECKEVITSVNKSVEVITSNRKLRMCLDCSEKAKSRLYKVSENCGVF